MRSRVMRKSCTSSMRSITPSTARRRPAPGAARARRRPARPSCAAPRRGSLRPDGLVEVVDRHRARDLDRRVVDPARASLSGRSYSLSISPTSSSRMSCSVTMPGGPAVLVDHDRHLPGAPRAARATARRGPWSSAPPAPRRASCADRRRRRGDAIRSRTCTIPTRWSSDSGADRVAACEVSTTTLERLLRRQLDARASPRRATGPSRRGPPGSAKSKTLCSSSSWARGITPGPRPRRPARAAPRACAPPRRRSPR